ncbi:hypothetical protein TELCIR_10848 [Teladorsagia circumcincta]|uniref:Uncharacterized protein n=1 Tax=Teladorsagia circumcincta TaxID=45464 RepID=A0A2G9UB09_TELCI|nr:hypothetical protein TELCIR_10848 [Teladorsagia circumcincta]
MIRERYPEGLILNVEHNNNFVVRRCEGCPIFILPRLMLGIQQRLDEVIVDSWEQLLADENEKNEKASQISKSRESRTQESPNNYSDIRLQRTQRTQRTQVDDAVPPKLNKTMIAKTQDSIEGSEEENTPKTGVAQCSSENEQLQLQKTQEVDLYSLNALKLSKKLTNDDLMRTQETQDTDAKEKQKNAKSVPTAAESSKTPASEKRKNQSNILRKLKKGSGVSV